MDKIAEQCKRHGSQGSKVVSCVRCRGDIQPYAGRRVAAYRDVYAHHAGQCADTSTREATTRSLADQPGLFAWSCTHVEVAGDLPMVCNAGSGDRAEYAEHMHGHGATELRPAVPPIKLRRKPGAGQRQAPRVPAFKRFTWQTTEQVPTGENWPAEQGGGPRYRELATDHRGQFWCNGADANSVVVIEDMRAAGLPNRLVTVYVRGDGSVTSNWSDAKRSRSAANRVAKRHAA